MLLILSPEIRDDDPRYLSTLEHLHQLPGIEIKVHQVDGEQQRLTEIYLIGRTQTLDQEQIASLPAVDKVIRIAQEYRILGRHSQDQHHSGFDYQGLRFDQNSFHLFAGLCAVDHRQHVELMLKALAAQGLQCTRMGAYKPRTSPYAFQGHGASCLPWVFELCGQYGMKVVAMEITHEAQIDEIDQALQRSGSPTGVMLQVGTRNIQNFELLKAIGRQKRYPVLLKRGFGITLNESLNAAEYLASEGNSRVIFCLRGMKSEYGSPHRNLVDFAHVPVIKRLTRMPVCIDPSHSVGSRAQAPDGILEIVHATVQGIVAGANMVLVDFHPQPEQALVDGPQALLLSELAPLCRDIELARALYQQRRAVWASHCSTR